MHMKTLTVSLASLVLVLGASQALAGYTGSLQLKQDLNNYSSGDGGEFRVANFVDSGTTYVLKPDGIYNTLGDAYRGAGMDFQTFCIEKDEYFNPDGTFTWNLNNKAVAGGDGSHDAMNRAEFEMVGAGDVICPETAWLYTEFWNGSLSVSGIDHDDNAGTAAISWSYDYTPDALSGGAGDRTTSAGHLQQAIWFLEGELGDAWNGTTYRTSTIYTGLSDEARALITAAFEQGWTNYGDVRVLNLTQAGVLKQDQLVMTNGNDIFEVPLPPAAPLGLVLLGGLGLYSRLRRRGRLED